MVTQDEECVPSDEEMHGRLRRLRKLHGIPGRVVASRIGLQLSNFYRCESSARPVPVQHVAVMAGLLGVAPEDLLGDLLAPKRSFEESCAFAQQLRELGRTSRGPYRSYTRWTAP